MLDLEHSLAERQKRDKMDVQVDTKQEGTRVYSSVRIHKVENGWILEAQNADVPYISGYTFVFSTPSEVATWIAKNLS